MYLLETTTGMSYHALFEDAITCAAADAAPDAELMLWRVAPCLWYGNTPGSFFRITKES